MLVGSVIRAVGHRTRELARLPYSRLRSHQVVIGGTGTGKTTLLLRLWAAFMATALRRYAAGQGEHRCWWCWTARAAATRAGSLTGPAGYCARRAPGPPRSGRTRRRCRCGRCPTRQLITTLADLVEHGTGGAAFYADVLDAVVALAVGAPGGPPVSNEEFLARLIRLAARWPTRPTRPSWI